MPADLPQETIEGFCIFGVQGLNDGLDLSWINRNALSVDNVTEESHPGYAESALGWIKAKSC